MNWKNQKIEVGAVKENTQKAFSFFSTKPLDIEAIKVGCGGCTKVQGYNKNTNELKVIYKAGKFPKHLPGISELLISQKIKIIYKDKSVEILNFTVNLIEA